MNYFKKKGVEPHATLFSKPLYGVNYLFIILYNYYFLTYTLHVHACEMSSDEDHIPTYQQICRSSISDHDECQLINQLDQTKYFLQLIAGERSGLDRGQSSPICSRLSHLDVSNTNKNFQSKKFKKRDEKNLKKILLFQSFLQERLYECFTDISMVYYVDKILKCRVYIQLCFLR